MARDESNEPDRLIELSVCENECEEMAHEDVGDELMMSREIEASV